MTPLSLKAIVLAAADRLSPPGAWCQGSYALMIGTMPVMPADPDATSWCAKGACVRAAADADHVEDQWLVASDIYNAYWEWRNRSLVQFNDAPGRTQAEVVAELRAFAETLI